MNETKPSTDPSVSRPETQQDLRFFVYGLGVVVLVISLALALLTMRQNQNLETQLKGLKAQITQYDQNQAFQRNRSLMDNLIREVAQQTPLHPEAKDILARYNIRVETPAPAAAAVK